MKHTGRITSSPRNAVAAHLRRIVAVTVFLTCVLASAVLTASPANAASRGFTVTNNSTETLRLLGVNHVNRTVCSFYACVDGVRYPMEFEGRPRSGSDIDPGQSQRFELKYGFAPELTAVQYAAKLTYKIERSNAQVEYVIETTPTANNSSCRVIPADAGTCTAGGLDLTFTAS